MGALRRYQGRFYTILYSFIRLFWLFVQYLGLGQLSPAQEQHKGRCSIVRGASITLHTILLGVGGTIYNNHTLESFKELGLNSQRVKKLASKLHVHSVNYAAKLVHTIRALSSTIINSHKPGDGFRSSLRPS